MEIPGMISKKNSKMTEAEVQAMRDKFANLVKVKAANNSLSLDDIQNQYPGMDISKVTNSINQSNVIGLWNQVREDPDALMKSITSGDTGNFDWLHQQPYIGDMLPQRLTPQYDPYDKSKYFPTQQPYTTPDPLKTPWDQKLMDEMLKFKTKKSAFEEIIDALFDTAEKEQFLMSVGYEIFQEGGKDWIRKVDSQGYETKGERGVSIDILFLREISIKFKNLLLAKASLKLKI